MTSVQIGNYYIGDDHPTFIIAEIGINHNGDISKALDLIDVAVDAGCNAVKFQKRVPEISVPEHYRTVLRDTPWGRISYLDYKKHVELSLDEFEQIDRHCKHKDIMWFASCWDIPSVDVIERFDVPAYKIASASITDHALLRRIRDTGKPVIMSTGMSTTDEVMHAWDVLNEYVPTIMCHTTSTYPCSPDELNLRLIPKYKSIFNTPVGYSGHEVGLQTTVAAVALGANLIERHITLDRTLWGTDQAASIEPQGLERLVRDIRIVERALGNGCKQVYRSELPVRDKLRRVGV